MTAKRDRGETLSVEVNLNLILAGRSPLLAAA